MPALTSRRLPQCLLASLLCAWAGFALADYDAAPRRDIDLSGTWLLNPALSDDAEELLAQQLEEEHMRDERWRRREERARPPGAPPRIDVRPRESGTPRPWQRQQYENFRRMLAISSSLTIKQEGAMLEIVSSVESRRFEAGSHSQVSMPEGQLADSEVGWDGDWFVIERSVRNGPRSIEKFRLLPRSNQLEYYMKWSGETELAGMKVRRVFDRSSGEAPPPNAAVGPVR